MTLLEVDSDYTVLDDAESGVVIRATTTPSDALVAFLNTLTDSSLTNDRKFGDPFLIFSQHVFLPIVVK